MGTERKDAFVAKVVGRQTAGAYGLLLLTTFFWGANTVFAKLAVGEISPMALVSLRWLGVVLVLAPFAYRSIARDWAALRARWPYLMSMGALGLAVFNGVFYWAAHHTSAINIGILQGVMPMFILLGTFGLYRVRISLYQTFGVGITMLGVAVVGLEGDLDQLRTISFNWGDLLVLFACVLYAAYTIGLRRRPDTGAVTLFFALASAAFLMSLPMLLTEVNLGLTQPPTTVGWVIAALVTVFPSLLAQIFFIHGVQLIGPARAGIFLNLVPLFAVALAFFVLDERLQMHHLVALILVVAGIGLAERSSMLGGSNDWSKADNDDVDKGTRSAFRRRKKLG